MLEPHDVVANVASDKADAFQRAILPKVSRTFALTIPQLPEVLRRVVTNAYMLTRIADTIEDEPVFSVEQKCRYLDVLSDVVNKRADAQRFAEEIVPLFSTVTLDAERDLVRHLPLVLQVTWSLTAMQFMAISDCLEIMCRGMCHFRSRASLDGFATLQDMDVYCYCVAGVVGDMLTELFVEFEPSLKAQRHAMLRLAASFGQALQMTNILKDRWDDRRHGICLLPRDVFSRHGICLSELQSETQVERHVSAFSELIGVAHVHLRRAFEYALMIPLQQSGIRRFLLWTIGLSVLTLKNMYENPYFISGAHSKISRDAVVRMTALVRLLGSSNAELRRLFDAEACGLPLTALSAEWEGDWPRTSLYKYFACVRTRRSDVDM